MALVDDASAEHDQDLLDQGPSGPSERTMQGPSGPSERATEGAPAAEGAGGGASGRSKRNEGRVPPLLWAAMALLAALALGAALLAADAAADRNRERGDRQEVEEVAGRLATALSTYDYRDFEATKRRVLMLSTGAFASEYERAVGALSSLIDQTKATSEATAGDVFVGDLGEGKASAIVVLEIRASGVGGPRVSVDNDVDLSLVKVEGEWKVDGVRNLNLGVAGGGGAAPPAAGPAASTAAPKQAP